MQGIDELLTNIDLYAGIKAILIDNCIQFTEVKNVSKEGTETERLEVFSCGLTLNKKEELVRQLLDGEYCSISSSNETMRITV